MDVLLGKLCKLSLGNRTLARIGDTDGWTVQCWTLDKDGLERDKLVRSQSGRLETLSECIIIVVSKQSGAVLSVGR